MAVFFTATKTYSDYEKIIVNHIISYGNHGKCTESVLF